MDSDSSHDGDGRRDAGKRRDWDNRQNSDVSDDENFSRGAKSIDSPPESPPRGGGNLDSPPASPAQGVESPHSVYSGSRHSSGSSSVHSGEYPQSPDSPPPKSESPDRDDSLDRAASRGSNRSRSGSPDACHVRSNRSESISPSVRSSRGERYGSPESNDSRHDKRRVPHSPEERNSISREGSSSPQRRYDRRRDRSGSQDSEHAKREGSSSPMISSSHRTPNHDHYPRRTRSRSSSPYKRGDRRSPIENRAGGDVSPDSCSSRNRTRDRGRRSPSYTSIKSLDDHLSPLSSNNCSPNPVRANQRSNNVSPDRCSDEKETHRRGRSLSLDNDNDSRASSQTSNHIHCRDRRSNDRQKSYNYGGSPGRLSDSDGRSNISSNSSIGSPASHKSRGSDSRREQQAKVEIKSHGEDLSDVSDVESIGSASDEELQRQQEIKKVCMFLTIHLFRVISFIFIWNYGSIFFIVHFQKIQFKGSVIIRDDKLRVNK